jgi:hypothetical protein
MSLVYARRWLLNRQVLSNPSIWNAVNNEGLKNQNNEGQKQGLERGEGWGERVDENRIYLATERVIYALDFSPPFNMDNFS